MHSDWTNNDLQTLADRNRRLFEHAVDLYSMFYDIVRGTLLPKPEPGTDPFQPRRGAAAYYTLPDRPIKPEEVIDNGANAEISWSTTEYHSGDTDWLSNSVPVDVLTGERTVEDWSADAIKAIRNEADRQYHDAQNQRIEQDRQTYERLKARFEPPASGTRTGSF